MSDSEGSEEDRPIRSSRVPIDNPNGEGRYVIEMKLFDGYDYKLSRRVDVTLTYDDESSSSTHSRKKAMHSIDDGTNSSSNVTNHDGEKIGYLTGNLLHRPSPIFFEMADADSGELQGLACLFCEADGKASRVNHPVLRDDENKYGGFFHIAKVEVRKHHKGKDLALLLIHHTLVFLSDLWTLAVMEAGYLNYHCLKWKDNDRLGFGSGSAETEEEKERTKQGSIAVMRHYARMGFFQAGQNRGTYTSWFLTKKSYFGDPQPNNDHDASIKRWISKESAQNEIDVFYPPPRRVPSPLDEELQSAITSFSGTDVSSLEDIVRRGASIDSSCAMHFACANMDTDVAVLEALVSLGGNVNAADDNRNTPLHVAAAMKKVAAVRYLIRCGANRSAVDSDGATPLDAFQKSEQSSQDFATAMGLSFRREIDKTINKSISELLSFL